MVQSWNKENGKMSRRTLMKTLGLTGAAVLSGGLTGGLMHSIRADSNSESDAGGRLDQIEEKLVHISDALERCPLDLHAFESYVQNDDWTVAFKHAFEQLRDEGGGILYIPEGTYLVSSTLVIYENTTIVAAPNAVIKRNGLYSPMFTNGNHTDVFYGYDGNGNITIVGGVWDGNVDEKQSQFTHFMFGHARNILFYRTKMMNNGNSHFIELNAVDTGEVASCIFERMVMWGDRHSEAIQIDLAKNSSVFPPFGAYDDTPCRNISVLHCTFKDCDRGVGSHSGTESITHSHIRIIGNHFERMRGQCIRTYNYEHAVISNNTIDDARLGIVVEGRLNTEIRNIVISNNTLKNIRRTSSGHRKAIWVFSEAASSEKMVNIIIEGNTIEGVDEWAVALQKCTNFTVANNTIVRADDHGIYITGCSHGVVSHNPIADCHGDGIHVIHSEDVLIDSNFSTSNLGNGIYGSGINHCKFTNNAVRNNGKDGIVLTASLADSADNDLMHNISLHNGQHGIVATANILRTVIDSNKAIANGTKAPGSYDGIRVSNGANHSILKNNVSFNGGTNFQRNGLAVSSACQHCIIKDNILKNSGVSSNLSDNGSDSIKEGNIE